MNAKFVSRILGLLVCFISATMVIPLSISAWHKETESAEDFAFSMAVGLLLGGALYLIGRKAKEEFFRREGLAVVSLGWFLAAGVGAVPFYLCEEFREQTPHGFADAFFESMSGFTTTGSTVLGRIELLPEGMLFWRSLIQWLGGMGIIVLFVAFLPALGVYAKHLYKVEIPGIQKEGAVPRIRESAMLLWKIYLAFTAAEALLLKLAGMSWYDAFCHTFTTLATGGFSTRTPSIAAFNSFYIELIIIIFMILVGMNFSLHISLFRGKLRDLARDPELRAYLAFIAAAVLLVAGTLILQGGYRSPAKALRHSAFQAVSIMTTTGYCTADFNAWPPFARLLLLSLMFVGGCAGSTGGAMKVIRVVIAAKLIKLQAEKFYFPRLVKQVKVGHAVLPEETVKAVSAFVILFVATWAGGTLFMAALGLDPLTAASSVIAALGNIGPGLAKVGPAEHFGWIHPAGKAFLSLCMVMGRLELFSVLVLFLPAFWRK